MKLPGSALTHAHPSAPALAPHRQMGTIGAWGGTFAMSDVFLISFEYWGVFDDLSLYTHPSAPALAPHLASFGNPPALEKREPQAPTVQLD